MRTFETLTYHCDDHGIAVITLSRPEKLNALSATVLDELEILFTECQQNDAIKALLLTGSGKAFCAGADINQLAKASALTGYAFAKRGQAVFRQLETLNKPSLAAINGFAFGGGCELAMSATMRIASSTAQFGQPEVKLGIIPGYGGTVRLAKLVGKGRALDLCLTGRFIDAATALQWGLVSEVVSLDNLISTSTNWLLQIMQQAPLAITAVMETIDTGFDLSLDTALEVEALQFAKTCASEDKAEGVSAFLEKRKAQFKGQ